MFSAWVNFVNLIVAYKFAKAVSAPFSYFVQHKIQFLLTHKVDTEDKLFEKYVCTQICLGSQTFIWQCGIIMRFQSPPGIVNFEGPSDGPPLKCEET